MTLTKTCPECEDQFETYQSVDKTYCSKECSREGRKKKQEKKCPGCGEVFQYHARTERVYCDRECWLENAYEVTYVTQKCPECNEDFSFQKGFERTYCSRKCMKNAYSGSFAGEQYQFGGQARQTVEETGHEVLSGWEEKVDLLLHQLGVNYEYEPRKFDLGSRTYTPDFIVGDTVIEVKGYSPKKTNREMMFMNQFPEYEYVVVGVERPADRHIEWNNREKIEEVVA